MISDAFVEVTCNKCQETEKVQLDISGKHVWHWERFEDTFEEALDELGWKIGNNDTHTCQVCLEEASEPVVSEETEEVY